MNIRQQAWCGGIVLLVAGVLLGVWLKDVLPKPNPHATRIWYGDTMNTVYDVYRRGPDISNGPDENGNFFWYYGDVRIRFVENNEGVPAVSEWLGNPPNGPHDDGLLYWPKVKK